MSHRRLWSLKWSNPYTSPPDGMPRELAEEITGWDDKPENLYKMLGPCTGGVFEWPGRYALCVSPLNVDSPRRELSLASKQSIRRKALARRMRAKNPLFAETMIAAELAAQPEYYGEEK